jgi:hypothetical protein
LGRLSGGRSGGRSHSGSCAHSVWSWRVDIWSLATCSSAYFDHEKVGRVKVSQMRRELPLCATGTRRSFVFMRSVRRTRPSSPTLFGEEQSQSEQRPERTTTLLLGPVALLSNVVPYFQDGMNVLMNSSYFFHWIYLDTQGQRCHGTLRVDPCDVPSPLPCIETTTKRRS